MFFAPESGRTSGTAFPTFVGFPWRVGIPLKGCTVQRCVPPLLFDRAKRSFEERRFRRNPRHGAAGGSVRHRLAFSRYGAFGLPPRNASGEKHSVRAAAQRDSRRSASPPVEVFAGGGTGGGRVWEKRPPSILLKVAVGRERFRAGRRRLRRPCCPPWFRRVRWPVRCCRW